ncbi:unnamed protein product [Chrysoparadoxa australica]
MPMDTEFHKSAHKGDIGTVRDMLEGPDPVDVNMPGAMGRTALHRAAGANQVSVIGFLLSAGADVNARDKSKRTPLHWACISGNIEAVDELLSASADILLKTTSGTTCLMSAVEGGYYDIAETLLEIAGEREIDVPGYCNMRGADEKTAYDLAKGKGDKAMMKLIKSVAPQPGFFTSLSSSARRQTSQPMNGTLTSAASLTSKFSKHSKGGGGGGGGGGGKTLWARVLAWFQRSRAPAQAQQLPSPNPNREPHPIWNLNEAQA